MRYDYPDPGQDPEYCDGLAPHETDEQEQEERDTIARAIRSLRHQRQRYGPSDTVSRDLLAEWRRRAGICQVCRRAEWRWRAEQEHGRS